MVEQCILPGGSFHNSNMIRNVIVGLGFRGL